MAEELLQRLLAANDPAEKAALVARSVLENEESVLAELVPVLAFLRWFDEPVVAALLPESERARSAERFARLIELPFVERVAYGYALHDLTRQGLLNEGTTEQRLIAAQAVQAFATEGDAGRQLECLYCLVLGEESEAARKLLDEQLDKLGGARSFAGFTVLFSALDEAESLIGHTVVERSPSHWLAQGLAKRTENDYYEAIANYDQAIAINPEYAAAYNNRGLTYADLGEYAAAISDYDRAIAIFPNGKEKSVAFRNRGNAHYAQGEYATAISDYDSAIELSPKDAVSYRNRGNAHYAQGEYTIAIADYDRAIELNPEDADAYMNRGNTLYLLGEYQSAIADYDKTTGLNPQDTTAYYYRDLARQNLQKHHAAIAPNLEDAVTYIIRGHAWTALGEHQAAIADYDRAIALNPEDADIYYNRGNAYAALGEQQAAMADYAQAIALNPDHAHLYYQSYQSRSYLRDLSSPLNRILRDAVATQVLSQAMDRLALVDKDAAELIKQRFYSRMTINEIAGVRLISHAYLYRLQRHAVLRLAKIISELE